MIVLNLEPDNFSKKAIFKLNKYFTYKEKKEIISSDKKKVVAIITKLKFNIDKEILKQFKNLKYIICNTTGIDHIDLNFCKTKKIQIISLKNEKIFMKKINSTAEFTFGLLLSLVRKIPFAFNDVIKMNWKRNNFIGRDLYNMSLGIIGMGRNGKKIANYAKAFGMKVYYCERRRNKKKIKGLVKILNLESLVKKVDIVVITCSLNSSSHNLINSKIFKLFKKGSYLINTSRGEIICEKSLLKALKQKRIFGAALDVIQNERNLKKNNILIKYAKRYSNLIITPHIGGANIDAWEMTENKVIDRFIELSNKN